MRMRVLAIRTGEEWRTFAGVLCESFCHRSFCGQISAGLAITVQYDEVSLSTIECSGASPSFCLIYWSDSNQFTLIATAEYIPALYSRVLK